MLNLSTFRPVRHLRRYQHIVGVFVRHGFGFALSQITLIPASRREQLTSPPPETLPVHFRKALEELGPTFVKLGQMLSTRPDLLPPSYLNELTKLQDTVPPVEWQAIRAVIEEELTESPEEVFWTIDPEPMAAASLGQVHGATLRGGQEVVVKVQRPGILGTIKTDLEILQDLAHHAQRHTSIGQLYRFEEIAEEFADTLRAELDYRREGRNADRLRSNFADEDFLHIPQVYWEHTTKRVLVLERIFGIKIDDIPAIEAAGYSRERIANHAARLIIQEVLQDGFFHADPHPGNFVVMENEVIGAMDFGMVGYLTHEDRQNLIRIYTVAVRFDVEGVVDELIHIGAAPPSVNRRALGRDVERLLRRYYSVPLKDVRANEVINQVMPIMFEHHLQLPTNLWLLAKTLAMMEGIGKQLDPDFDIFKFSKPYVTRLLLGMFIPSRRSLESALRRGMVWNDLLVALPRTGLTLLDRIEKGQPISMKLDLDRHSVKQLDRMVTRLALSLIVLGMIVGTALVVPATAGGSSALQVIVAVGFVISLALGAWVILSIIRGGS
jgi:ubiquinone biosynthesis protein